MPPKTCRNRIHTPAAAALLRRPLTVRLAGQHTVDAGGVLRAWLSECARQLASEEEGLFTPCWVETPAWSRSSPTPTRLTPGLHSGWVWVSTDLIAGMGALRDKYQLLGKVYIVMVSATSTSCSARYI